MKKVTYDKLTELRAVAIKDGKYIYSKEFEESAESIKANPPSRLKQVSAARWIAKDIKPLLLSTAQIYTNRKDFENLIVAYVCLDRHIERLKLSAPKESYPELAHALWYLNDHELEVKEAEP